MNSVMSKSFAARRVLAASSRLSSKHGAMRRTFHATSALGGDALDMVDTFARRHCEFFSLSRVIFCGIL